MTPRLTAGAIGGFAGALVFGAMLHMMGMIAMIGGLIGAENVAAGWIVHLVIGTLIGVGYSLTFGLQDQGYGAGAGYGLAYGGIWWVLGPLLIMPLWLGMPALQLGAQQFQSLIGHLAYGLILGLVFVAVRGPTRERIPERERELVSR